jgi:ATP-dependent DNA helicase DinG
MTVRSLEGLLGPKGVLARKLEGYEARPGQLEMARKVEAALQERHYLMVEAGTGTGKTLAYLVPAIRSGRKVVVSTATKNLQTQIMEKDLPLLRKQGGLDFKAALMKGRANYLCLLRYERFAEQPDFAFKDEARHFPRLKVWAEQTSTGDRADLDLPETFHAWREMSATADTCIGSKCPRYQDCFVTQMRQAAQEADVIVVNHHLFFADVTLKARKSSQGAEVLPRYDAVIFDEAHALEDVASDHFGATVSTHRVEDLCADGERLVLPGNEAYETLSPTWNSLRRGAQELFAALLGEMTASGVQATSEAVKLGEPLRKAAQAHAGELIDALSEIQVTLEEATEPEMQGLARRADEVLADLGFLLGEADGRFVYAVEQRARTVTVRAHPIDVAQEMAKRLYAHLDTAVFTSATLSVGGSFAYAAERLGLVTDEGEPVNGLQMATVASPFDYARQAILYVPQHLPEVQSPEFSDAATEEIVRLCELTGGRAFVLCTSLKSMRELHGKLEGRLPYPLLLQGERPKHKLLEAFLQEPSVLLGAYSFWEGVDVQGDALSLVIIDKLPFANPRDPVVEARVGALQGKGVDPFASYQIPQAALALRQGFGRLIRSKRDTGIVALLDRRLRTKRYGPGLIDALPPAWRIGVWEKLPAAWAALQKAHLARFPAAPVLGPESEDELV